MIHKIFGVSLVIQQNQGWQKSYLKKTYKHLFSTRVLSLLLSLPGLQ